MGERQCQPPTRTALCWDAQPGPPTCPWASAPALQLGTWRVTSEVPDWARCSSFIQGLASLDVMGSLPHLLPHCCPPPIPIRLLLNVIWHR